MLADRVIALIASQLRDMNFDSDTNVIDFAIGLLRTKIGDDFEFKLYAL